MKVIPYNVIKINLLETSYSKRYRKIYKEKYYNKIDGPPYSSFSTNPMHNPESAKKCRISINAFFKTENGKQVAINTSKRMKENNPMRNPEIAKKVGDKQKGRPNHRKGKK